MPVSNINDDFVLTPEQIEEFEREYQITANMQKTCGQIIYEIIENKGILNKRRTKYKIDVNKVSDLTGLDSNRIYIYAD